MNTPQTIEHDPEEIEALAITLRAECLSGYRWNVAKWAEVHWMAKDVWRGRAVAFSTLNLAVFHVKQVKHRKRKPGLCPCGREQKRPGQGYGNRCQAKAQAAYRRRLLIEAGRKNDAELHAIAERHST
jgi:hypothetical protein